MASQSEPITTTDVPDYIGLVTFIGIAFGQAQVLSLSGLNSGFRISNANLFALDNALTPNAAAQNTVTEDASIAAMTHTSYAAGQTTNNMEIHRNTYAASYAVQAFANATAGVGIGGQPAAGINAMPAQRKAHLLQLIADLDYSFLRGSIQAWTNAGTAGQTKGVITAIEAGSETAAGGAALSKGNIETEVIRMAAAGAEFQRPIIAASGFQIAALNTLYGNPPTSIEIGGTKVNSIHLPIAGECGIVHDPHIAADDLAILDLAHLTAVFGIVPGKGSIFTEPLAKIAAADYEQLYTLFGCDYENVNYHGMVSGNATS